MIRVLCRVHFVGFRCVRPLARDTRDVIKVQPPTTCWTCETRSVGGTWPVPLPRTKHVYHSITARWVLLSARWPEMTPPEGCALSVRGSICCAICLIIPARRRTPRMRPPAPEWAERWPTHQCLPKRAPWGSGVRWCTGTCGDHLDGDQHALQCHDDVLDLLHDRPACSASFSSFSCSVPRREGRSIVAVLTTGRQLRGDIAAP